MNRPVSRRSAVMVAVAAALGSTAALAAMTTGAEAGKGGWGRGRKRGWWKRGGPRWRRGGW